MIFAACIHGIGFHISAIKTNILAIILPNIFLNRISLPKAVFYLWERIINIFKDIENISFHHIISFRR